MPVDPMRHPAHRSYVAEAGSRVHVFVLAHDDPDACTPAVRGGGDHGVPDVHLVGELVKLTRSLVAVPGRHSGMRSSSSARMSLGSAGSIRRSKRVLKLIATRSDSKKPGPPSKVGVGREDGTDDPPVSSQQFLTFLHVASSLGREPMSPGRQAEGAQTTPLPARQTFSEPRRGRRIEHLDPGAQGERTSPSRHAIASATQAAVSQSASH